MRDISKGEGARQLEMFAGESGLIEARPDVSLEGASAEFIATTPGGEVVIRKFPGRGVEVMPDVIKVHLEPADTKTGGLYWEIRVKIPREEIDETAAHGTLVIRKSAYGHSA